MADNIFITSNAIHLGDKVIQYTESGILSALAILGLSLDASGIAWDFLVV